MRRSSIASFEEWIGPARDRTSFLPLSKLHDFLVVTTAHDAEQFVRRNIDSVWEQDYPNARYRQLIIDDASVVLRDSGIVSAGWPLRALSSWRKVRRWRAALSLRPARL